MKNITAVYFSPTEGTKKACMALASAMSQDVKEVDLCASDWEWAFGPGDVVTMRIPVFGGRIPRFTAEELKYCRGNGAVTVTAAVYGNRAFEDALLELDDCLRAQGFRIAVGMALLAEYPMMGDIVSGRPDEQDMEDIRSLAARILDKLQEEDRQEPQVPGNRPYRDWKQMSVVSVTSDSCTACGWCVELCLAGVMPLDAPGTTKADQCMLCIRYVSICLTRARSLPAPALLMLEQKLSPVRDIRREDELFLQAYLSGLP